MTDATSHHLQTYEVRCPRCNVSFPPETRTCMHCGGKVAGGRIARAIGMDEPDHRAGMDPSATPFDFDMMEAEEADEGRSRSPLRFLGSLLWIVVIVLYSIARACSDG